MADRSFLAWPFFDDAHRALAREFEAFAATALPSLLDGAEDDLDAVYRCVRRLVREFGRARACCESAFPARTAGCARNSTCAASASRARRWRARPASPISRSRCRGWAAPRSRCSAAMTRSRRCCPQSRPARIAAFALSEPDAGSDVGAIATTATRDGNAWRLDGVKTWISNAGLADRYVVFARTGEGPGTKGLSAFIVDADTRGLDASERIDVIAPHPLGTLRLTDCRVPADRSLAATRPGIQDRDGHARCVPLDGGRGRAGLRPPGAGRGAGAHAEAAPVRPRVGRIPVDAGEPRRHGDRDRRVGAACLPRRVDEGCAGTRVTREASMAKLFATESAQQVIDAAVQLFGGLGVVRGTTVERLYREIRALRIYEGASEVLKLVIASKVVETAEPEGDSAASREPERHERGQQGFATAAPGDGTLAQRAALERCRRRAHRRARTRPAGTAGRDPRARRNDRRRGDRSSCTTTATRSSSIPSWPSSAGSRCRSTRRRAKCGSSSSARA